MKKYYMDRHRFRIYILSIFIISVILVYWSAERGRVVTKEYIVQQEQVIKSQITSEINKIETNNINVEPIETEKHNIYYDVPLSDEIQDYIREVSEQEEIKVKTVLAVMATESSFNHNTSSKNNGRVGSSIGLLQLNENHIEWYKELTGIKNFNIYNIKHNILGGIKVLKYYRDYWRGKVGYDELDTYMLNSYNAGINGFKTYIRETGLISRGYDKKVRQYRDNIKARE